MDNLKNDFTKRIIQQVFVVLATAATAALITFIQAIAVETGGCVTPILSPTDSGFLGGTLKVAHSLFQASRHQNIL